MRIAVGGWRGWGALPTAFHLLAVVIPLRAAHGACPTVRARASEFLGAVLRAKVGRNGTIPDRDFGGQESMPGLEKCTSAFPLTPRTNHLRGCFGTSAVFSIGPT